MKLKKQIKTNNRLARPYVGWPGGLGFDSGLALYKDRPDLRGWFPLIVGHWTNSFGSVLPLAVRMENKGKPKRISTAPRKTNTSRL